MNIVDRSQAPSVAGQDINEADRVLAYRRNYYGGVEFVF
jgi:hypothetical protein